jgi:hypothetical protein
MCVSVDLIFGVESSQMIWLKGVVVTKFLMKQRWDKAMRVAMRVAMMLVLEE